MVNETHLISDLKQIMGREQKVEILNFYKGLPVSSSAQVQSIEGDVAVLKIEPPCSVCLEWEDTTWLLVGEPLGAVACSVLSFDILEGIGKLGNWDLPDARFGNRMNIRVEPAEPTLVDVEGPVETVIAQLHDVSLTGVGMRLSAEIREKFFKKYDRVKFTLHLPNGSMRLSGQIKTITPLGEDERLGIVFTETITQRGLIPSYISCRRIAILQELTARYDMAFEAQAAAVQETS